MSSRSYQENNPLTPNTPPTRPPLTDVLDGFREIAACTGGKSQEKKVGIIRKLLLNCAKEGAEVKFLVRGALVGLA